MDNEPIIIADESVSRLEIFTDGDFIGHTHAIEHTLNSTAMPPRARRGFLRDAVETLNEHFGTELIRDQVDIAGYAYIADEDGRLLINDDGDVTQGYVEYEEVTYSGIDIIKFKTNNPDVNTDKPTYKIVCKIKHTSYDDDGTGYTQVYYIPPGDILRFEASYEDDEGDEFDPDQAQQDVIEEFVGISQRVVRHHTFTLASGREQHRTLRNLGRQLYDDVISTYGNNTVKVNATEFFIIPDTQEGEKPSMYLIDQTSEPIEEWTSPTGAIRDCKFIETIQSGGIGTSKIRSLIRETPCIVMSIEDRNATCLIPLTAFNFADIIDDTI